MDLMQAFTAASAAASRRLPARTPTWPTITPAAAGPVPATCQATREADACTSQVPAVDRSQPPIAGPVADLAIRELSGRTHPVVVPG